MTLMRIGIGTGTKDFEGHPNILRVLLGERTDVVSVPSLPSSPPQQPQSLTSTDSIPTQSSKIIPLPTTTTTQPSLSSWDTHTLTQLEANIDDATPEVLAHVMDKLLQQETVVDVWIRPILMKKGRAAHQLCCLCRPNDDDHDDQAVVSHLLRILFAETTTLGVRVQTNVQRIALPREFLKQVPTCGSGDDNDNEKFVDVKLGVLDGRVVTVSPEYEQCRRVAVATNTPLQLVMDEAKSNAMSMVRQQQQQQQNVGDDAKTKKEHSTDNGGNKRNTLKVFSFKNNSYV